MAQRQSWDEKITRDVKLAIRNASSAFEQAKADATARGQTLVRQVQQRVEASAAQYGARLVASGEALQQGQAGMARAINARIASRPAPTRSTARPVSAMTKPPPRADKVHAVVGDFNAPIAGLKSLQSALYAGQDDKIIAGIQTVLDGGAEDFFRRFAENIRRQEDLSAKLQSEFPVSTATGAGVGMVASIATGAPMAALRSAAPRTLSALKNGRSLGNTARLIATPRQHLTTAAGGGLVNAGVQGAFDLIQGEASSPQTLAGAFVGGALGTRATTLKGPTLGAAVEGFTTSLTQDLLAGESLNVADAFTDAATGARLGSMGDVAGTRWMERLGSNAKGKVGERLSIVKQLADWDLPNFREVRLDLPGGGYTRLDPASSGHKRIESKAGKRPSISKSQLRARALDPARYQIDWWHNSDAGKIAGHLLGTAGGHIAPSHEMQPKQMDTGLRQRRYPLTTKQRVAPAIAP